MMTRKTLLWTVPALLALVTAVYAQMVGFDGVMNTGGNAGGGGTGCIGAINLTKGCALPMLGGIP